MDDNLVDLGLEDEGSLLEILKEREKRGENFTFLGDVLVALNAFRGVSKQDLANKENAKGPHPHGVALSMYEGICEKAESQCCVIAGETCSGKTEIGRIVLSSLLKLLKAEKPDIQYKITMANIILDAFGHAKTPLSRNATRFGKFLQFFFSPDRTVISASFSDYMLEKTRVIRQRKEGRNFHIFYYLFHGMSQEELDQLYLGTMENHRYLGFGTPLADSQAEENYLKRMYLGVCKSMKNIGFTIEEIADCFQVLSGILNVGNMKFATKDDSAELFVNTTDSIENAAILLGMDKEKFEKALTTLTATVDGETMTAAKSISKASVGRDLLSKELYGRLFSWIVFKINSFIQCLDHKKKVANAPSLGLLDIFGFEEFETNTFEQLCVNSANEQLNFFYVQHIFAWEKLEHEQEGVEGLALDYPDNKTIINLLLEKPSGLFALLDEESRYPNADDNTLVSKFNANCVDHTNYSNISSKRPMFAITHFNGKVHYFVDGFLQKNRATISSHIIDCLKDSSNSVVSSLFQGTISKTGSFVIDPNSVKDNPKDSKQTPRKRKTSEASSTSARGRKQKPNFTTGTQFRNSLVELMEKILQSQPHFIRCIKSNNSEKPNEFDDSVILKQIQGFCLYDTLRVREDGFPARLTFKQFLERYKFICFPLVSTIPCNRENVEIIMNKSNIFGHKFGNAKVFLKHRHENELDSHLEKVKRDVVTVQKMFRGRLARIDYEFLMNNRKHEERTIGNFLMSVSTKPAKLHEALITMSKQDVRRHDKENDETRRKLRENQKKKAAKMITDSATVGSRRPRSKDDFLVGSRKYGSQKQSGRPQIYGGELPLMRDFTRGRLKAWCRVDCYERQFHVASFFLHQSVITIDGSNIVDDSAKIGLCYLPSKTGDAKVLKVKNCIGKGLKLHQDDSGNVWATRIGKNPIFVRGYFLSPELIKLNGKLTQGVPMKIFDVGEYKDTLNEECSNAVKDEQATRSKLMGTCKVCISFIKDTMVDEETPCWIEVWFVEHVETIRKKLLAVLKSQGKSMSSKSSNPTPSESKEAKQINDGTPKKLAVDIDPTKDPKQAVAGGFNLVSGTEKIARNPQVNKNKGKPGPIEDIPLPESEVRTALRSPHIAVADGKVILDYGSYARRATPMTQTNEVPETELMPEMEMMPESEFSQIEIPTYNPSFGYNYELPEANGQDPQSTGLSYGKVFGMSAYDYAFDFVPPSYRRHRRHSDSDSESVRNFMSTNMPIHGILELEEKKSTPLQPMKWISKKTRRKSEDQRRKAFPVR
ncbi:myosin-IIIb-like [Rhopilema esculentum]|uniref:myosin-IIIb-like n=1 Tax=Rhopilema esculentum TaxID=499914 RepID=UPI0031D84EBB